MTTRNPKSEYARALDSLTRLLALRDHSRHELRAKLGRRFPSELVQKLLSDAEENGWLADEQLVAERAALALQRKLKSRRHIEGTLRKRGLPVPPPDEAVELENARALVEKKLGRCTGLSFEERAKAYRYLQYRGFNPRVIRMVFDAK